MLRLCDLFCGLGSFTRSFEELGMKSVFACDIDPSARNHYRRNFKHQVSRDIRKVDMSKVPAFDILTAGFPCQAWSTIGKGLGQSDPRGKLVFETLKFLDKHNPRFAVFENVRAILQYKEFMTELRETLTSRGYVLHEKVLNCSNYGCPQNRYRLFLVAIREDVECENFFDDMETSSLSLSDLFEDKGLTFERNFSKTIRCGGRGGRIDSGYCWRRVWVFNENDDRVEYAFTLEDCQSIQGFKNYKFFGLKKDLWQLIGNTIPTSVTKAIGKRIMQVLQLQPPSKKRLRSV
jgi:DNA (cytosine-5)-methyltransferase 1